MTGIYKITNTVNNKVYIGQALDIHSRIRNHKEALNRGTHPNNHLQRAWNLYGKDKFVFSIVESCEESQLTEREQFWIDFYGGINSNDTYNQRDAGSHGSHSEETRLKISKTQLGVPKGPGRKVSEEGRLSLSLSHMGKHPSEETRHKMSLAQMGRKHTEEVKKRIAETHKKRYLDNPELRKEISERMKGRIFSEEHRYKLGNSNRGKSYKDNKERIKKQSEGLKRAYISGKRKAVWITVNGITKMQSEWANLIDVPHTSIIYQRKKGDGYAEKYIQEMLIKKNIKL